MSTNRYNSKISIGLVLFISVPMNTIAFLLGYEDISSGKWTALFFIVLLWVFILHMLITTYYEINGENLLIKSGFFYKQTIDIMQIKEIKESNNLLSSPASSMDRLELKGHGFSPVLISPKEKLAFVEHLQKINPSVIFKPKLHRKKQH